MFRTHRLAITSASLLLLAPCAVAAQYSFVNIADTRGPFDGFDRYNKAVSDTGTVAFIGNQGGVSGTYFGSGGAVQPVVLNLSYPTGFSQTGDWALNESGVAAGLFGCCNPRLDTIQLYNASGASTVAEVMDGATFDAGFGEPAINNSGAVAFGTYRDEGSTRNGGLIRWVDGTSTTLVDFADGFRAVHSVSLNEQGNVAFAGATVLQGASVYRTDGTTVAPIAGPFQTIGRTAINDSGAVAFWSVLDAGGEGILVGDGGPLTTVAIADPTTPFSDFETDIDINNQGTVGFRASLWDERSGIYIGPDPANDKVVEIADLLFGYPVSSLGTPHLNNRGDIAFSFSVLDPSVPGGEWSGIALAVKESPIAGDYNLNGTVDAADYVVWRKTGGSPDDYNTWQANFGQSAAGPSLPGDFNGNGSVDAADYIIWRKGLGTTYTQNDYNTWRANFGATLGTGSSAFPAPSPFDNAVPEPASAALLLFAAVGSLVVRRSPDRARFRPKVSLSPPLPVPFFGRAAKNPC